MTVRCAAQSKGNRMLALTLKRREVIALVGIAAELSWLPCGVATGEGLPQTEPAKLCDVDCEKELENVSPAYRSSTSFLLLFLLLFALFFESKRGFLVSSLDC